MRTLLEAVFRPERPHLDAASAALRGIAAPEEAWRALAARNLLPPSWLDDSRRRFPALGCLPAHEYARHLRWAPYLPVGPHPEDPETCALFAADVRGMEEAEAHGRALCAALAPWGVPASEVVLWVPSSLSGYGYQLHDTKPGVWEPDSSLWRVFPEARWDDVCELERSLLREIGADHAGCTEAAQVVAPWVYGHLRWSECVARGACVDEHASTVAAGRPFADLPSPFAAALRLFQTGYAPLPSGNERVVLGYPARSSRP